MSPLDPVPEDWTSAVAVVAHPDDLEYGVASAVARWTGQGKRVSYVLVTGGEAGIDGMPPEETRRVREEEERRSAAAVGVDQVEFLGHPDGAIEAGLPLRRDIAAAYRRLQPDVVITMHFELTWGPGGNVNHADHRAVGLAAIDAARDAANRWLFTDLGEPWQGIGPVYVFAASNPTHFVDVTDTLDAGVASLQEHRAYIEGLGQEFDADEFLRRNAASAGEEVGCELAVLFQRFG